MKASALRLFLLLTLTLAATQPTFAADWPTYRADAARSGYTAEALPNRLELQWVYRSPHTPRPAWRASDRIHFDFAFQPIIVGETVIFGSSADDQVYAINAETGRMVWNFFTEGPVRFAPAAWKDRLFVSSDDGWLYALSVADGKLLWKHFGGPDSTTVLGNDRVVSHWPARGGPVVVDSTVYFAAGVWPSDGVYVYALDAESGSITWRNDKTGTLKMDQPHGGARAKSGVSAQGYLLAGKEHLFVPTGRAVPAVVERSVGELAYYHLRKNQHRGGTRALLADAFLLNSGVLFDQASGAVVSQIGYGPKVATPSGLLCAEGKSLAEYRWQTLQKPDRKGKLVKQRVLEKVRLINCEREVLECLVAGINIVCGEEGRVSAIDYTLQRNTWWSHEVDGRALGLAYGNGRLIVSTDEGLVYCFDGEPAAKEPITVAKPSVEVPRTDFDFANAAEEIIRKTGIVEGYCVDLGCGSGELALELAKRTKLQIYGIEADEKQVALARKRLDKAGLYADRVTVHHRDPAKPFYPPRFANLVISSRSFSEDAKPPASEMTRLQRPYGGVTCIGPAGAMQIDVRGELAGAGSWTHQNADAANTLNSSDRLIKGPLKMFWFRAADYHLPNRHGQAPAPLYHRGVMVVAGVDGLCAVDAYNGRTLWKYEIKNSLIDYDGIHHDVGVGETGGHFCLGGESVFVRTGNRCLRLDLNTGKKLAEYVTPASADAKNRAWGFLAYHDGLIYGTIANEEHTVSPRYRLSRLFTESVLLFAVDVETGEVRWRYQPTGSIRNNSIAIGADSLFLIDRPIVMADRITNPRRDGRPNPLIKPDEQPPGTLLAFEAQTGETRWKQTDDIFGTQLALSETHNILLMNFQAVRHKFFKLPSEFGDRIAALNASTGKRIWNVQAKYQSRPIINGTTIYSQGAAWELKTGKPVPFPLKRSYGCGQISSSENLMLFRSGTLGYLDLSRDAGTENFGGIRLGCWINAIPAGGLVLVPEGSTRCECSYQMKSWFALMQRE
ncbi:MAG: PQQ-binding-like beta-propeller repeat protein [Pirellulales bacterium]